MWETVAFVSIGLLFDRVSIFLRAVARALGFLLMTAPVKSAPYSLFRDIASLTSRRL